MNSEIEHKALIQRGLLLTQYGVDSDLDKAIVDTFPTYMRYGGEAQVSVDDIPAAKRVLQEHLGMNDDYFKEIYPENFFIKGCFHLPLVRTGKMDIVNVHLFLKSLIDNGVVLYNYHFDQNTCHECGI